MKVNSFFKILNRKINMYDKLATNPFTDKRKMIIVWIEEGGLDSYRVDIDDKKRN